MQAVAIHHPQWKAMVSCGIRGWIFSLAGATVGVSYCHQDRGSEVPQKGDGPQLRP